MFRNSWKYVGMALPVAVIAFAGFATVSVAQEKKVDDKAKGKDIVQTATDAGNFKTFTKLLAAAHVDHMLKEPGPYTVFAPDEAAFAKLPKGTVEEWQKPANEAKLKNILQYHVVKGKHTAADVAKWKTQKAANGAELTITNKDGTVMINNAKITKTDITASNGVIHTIDTVLMPAEKKPE